MGIMNFYKQPKPNKFRYVYRYFDSKEEELEKKIRRAKRRLDPDAPLDPEEVKENLKGAFHRQSTKLDAYEKSDNIKQSIIEKSSRLIIFLVLLLVLFVWLYRHIGIKYFAYYFGLNF